MNLESIERFAKIQFRSALESEIFQDLDLELQSRTLQEKFSSSMKSCVIRYEYRTLLVTCKSFEDCIFEISIPKFELIPRFTRTLVESLCRKSLEQGDISHLEDLSDELKSEGILPIWFEVKSNSIRTRYMSPGGNMRDVRFNLGISIEDEFFGRS